MSNNSSNCGCFVVGAALFILLMLLAVGANLLFDSPEEDTFESTLAMFVCFAAFFGILKWVGLIDFKKIDNSTKNKSDE